VGARNAARRRRAGEEEGCDHEVSGVTPPGKLSEVKPWLAAHPGIDPSVLARRDKQRASAKAAAIRALAAMGTQEALEVLAGYRPIVTEVDGSTEVEHEGAMGDTFADPVAREIAAAWTRFDRATFAARMFSGFGELWFANAGPLADLTGIEAITGLHDLRIFVAETADLSPLSRCSGLRGLEINIHGRTSGIKPVVAIRGLRYLALINAEALDQSSVDALAGAVDVTNLHVSVGGEVDISPLAKLPALERLQLAAGERRADARTVTALGEILARGAEVCLYAHERWSAAAAKALPGVTKVVESGLVVLTLEASRADHLRAALRANAPLS
jgi:hypothetical protein